MIRFYKYHGTGNDFILIDNRNPQVDEDNVELFGKMCSRRFGIGADGLILLKNHPDFDFEMKYYNSDGNESTMCGNGGRCIVKFAQDLGVFSGKKTKFLAIDGEHEAEIVDDIVALRMMDATEIEKIDSENFTTDTGSPHYVQFLEKAVDELNVDQLGAEIRYSEKFNAKGINVNFANLDGNRIKVRTYERGVEAETFSCGTGVCAVAVIARNALQISSNAFVIETKGGVLTVTIDENNQITLEGPATFVFQGNFSPTSKTPTL